MTKYFVSYAWKSRRGEWGLSEEITDKHPIEWLTEVRKKYGGEYIPGTQRGGEEYYLLFWTEIPEELAKKLKDEIG